VERVLALKPDLVLATSDGNSKDQIQHLKELGLKVVVVKTGDFNEIENSIQEVAGALGLEGGGKAMVAQFHKGIENLRAQAQKRKPIRVLIQVGDAPLVVAGGGSFLNDALSVLGAVNVYADSKKHYPHPSIEDVLAKNPDVIVVLSMSEDRKSSRHSLASWARFPKLKAVLNDRVHLLRTDALLRPSLRLLEGLSILDRVIYEHK
jgi:ABC-type Fe3+-hydroxamate transport system substrate-binding protein